MFDISNVLETEKISTCCLANVASCTIPKNSSCTLFPRCKKATIVTQKFMAIYAHWKVRPEELQRHRLDIQIKKKLARSTRCHVSITVNLSHSQNKPAFTAESFDAGVNGDCIHSHCKQYSQMLMHVSGFFDHWKRGYTLWKTRLSVFR